MGRGAGKPKGSKSKEPQPASQLDMRNFMASTGSRGSKRPFDGDTQLLSPPSVIPLPDAQPMLSPSGSTTPLTLSSVASSLADTALHLGPHAFDEDVPCAQPGLDRASPSPGVPSSPLTLLGSPRHSHEDPHHEPEKSVKNYSDGGQWPAGSEDPLTNLLITMAGCQTTGLNTMFNLEDKVNEILKKSESVFNNTPGEQPKSEKEKLLEAASQDKCFDMRSTVGGWWMKTLKTDARLAEEYKALGKSYAAQRAFRARWAAQQAEQCRLERQASQTNIEVSEEDISYEPLARIAHLEGSGDSGQQAALNYAAKCVELTGKGVQVRGHPFICYNSFTRRYDFAYIKKKVRFVFEQRWSEITTQSGYKSDKSGAPPVVADNKKKNSTGPGSNTSLAGKKDSAATESMKLIRKELDLKWRKVKSLKDKYTTAMANFHTIHNYIQHDPTWRWAQGVDLAELLERKTCLDHFADTSLFWKQFVLEDITVLRKKSDPADAQEQLRATEELSKLVGQLEDKCKTMTALQAVRTQRK